MLLVLVLAASGVPSPLYRVYQQEFGFSSSVLTTIFAVYAFALLASLLVVGALSDHVGRRPVLAVALLVEAVAMVLFLSATGVGWLLAARVVQGLATGAMTGAMGATLLDFQRPERPLGPLHQQRVTRLRAIRGAVAAGLLVAVRPVPDRLGVRHPHRRLRRWRRSAVLRLPESSPRTPGALRSLRPQVHVPAPQRPAFFVALPCLVASLGARAASTPRSARRCWPTSSGSTTTSPAACSSSR